MFWELCWWKWVCVEILPMCMSSTPWSSLPIVAPLDQLLYQCQRSFSCFLDVSLYLFTTVSPYATSYCGLDCTGLRVAAGTSYRVEVAPLARTDHHFVLPALTGFPEQYVLQSHSFWKSVKGSRVSHTLLRFPDLFRRGTRRSPHSLSFFDSMQRSSFTSRLSRWWRCIANFTPLAFPGVVLDTARIEDLVESLTNEKV
jgi:hypothetical protein